ncbi:prephenate dehydrogenase [Candidatus Methylomirabilis limnetica]|uniref:prephenate dehydrogenase n=1 Tax=Candidatus Methylomirabilis limnetica TaxID=2033718 RepID=UPI001379C01A|nr:prephenate dehydrogenase/arogenate dehydrogenase family protein [Candidatus Methylomirabilis limnetica]
MTVASRIEPPGAAASSSSPLVQRLAIIGLGLIGASVGLACRARGLAGEIRGADEDPDHCAQAVALGVVDWAAADAAVAVEGADIVLLAVPVGAMEPTIKRIVPHLDSGAVVTDVGSVKGLVAAVMERLLPGGNGVPGHPITGREKSGPHAASAELFVGSKCVLTPSASTDPAAVLRVRTLWRAIGSEVLEMSPTRHDDIFAAVSHLPHVVSYALMGAMLDLADGGDDLREFAAGGLKDFTRVAMSHPVMWRDICLANRQPILKMIGQFQAALDHLTVMINAEDGEGLYRQFASAKAYREGFGNGNDGDDRKRTA